MALSDADATVIGSVLALIGTVVGSQQWHVHRSARKKLAEDVTTVLTAKDEVISVQASEITYLRAELADERRREGGDGPAN